jgi:hypothetical protein
MKFPTIGAERLHVVESGLELLKNRMDELERYASVIPHKRSGTRNGSSEKSGPAQLHLVVGDVPFDVVTGPVPVG